MINRIAVDTNILVSWFLDSNSVSGRDARKASGSGILLASGETLNELADVLSRSKFDRYASIDERIQFVRLIGRVIEIVPIIQKVQICRDGKDDKFLELAVNGRADLLITGDEDLLVLNRFGNILTVSPSEYLARD